MKLKFTKMHGLGNDFIVIDGINQHVSLTKNVIARLSDRYTGIGFDQCLVVEKSNAPDVDFFYRIYNANGQEVGQCGNGARCLAKFIERESLTHKKSFVIATITTNMQLNLLDDETVTVSLGKPRFLPLEIPFLVNEVQSIYSINLANIGYHKIHVVNVGNPHAVLVMDNPTDKDVRTIGKAISEHYFFPQQTNVGFMTIESNNFIKLRVYERGCGETNACGSGAVAAAAIGRVNYNLAKEITVQLPGGKLKVIWPDLKDVIYLNGPAAFVYDGVLENICELLS
ncbi:MAG: diaminopimelate epimerase [Legionellales bacterium RIFCSPHIGHO2_12_FULL_35_11]|nr:MAG: diaminopimelate epimerase [Legionellales bacterium RIFCSPHIGHO2_12_FULL_35_11]